MDCSGLLTVRCGAEDSDARHRNPARPSASRRFWVRCRGLALVQRPLSGRPPELRGVRFVFGAARAPTVAHAKLSARTRPDRVDFHFLPLQGLPCLPLSAAVYCSPAFR